MSAASVRDELEYVMASLARAYDDVPFMDRRLPPTELAFQRMPSEMGRLLSQSPDYTSPEPGRGPVWLQLEGPDSNAELVVYRTTVDEELYVLAPVTGS